MVSESQAHVNQVVLAVLIGACGCNRIPSSPSDDELAHTTSEGEGEASGSGQGSEDSNSDDGGGPSESGGNQSSSDDGGDDSGSDPLPNGSPCSSNAECGVESVCAAGTCEDAYAGITYSLTVSRFGLPDCQIDPSPNGYAYYRYEATSSGQVQTTDWKHCQLGWPETVTVIASGESPVLSLQFWREYDEAEVATLCTGADAGCHLISKENLHLGEFGASATTTANSGAYTASFVAKVVD